MIEWWTAQEAGLYGGIAGAAVGLLGGLVGTLLGVLGPRGVGRRLVLGLMVAMVAAGVVSMIAGILAILRDQPYHVYYPLLLCGVIDATVMGGLLPVARGVYRRAEQNRISAEELRRA